MATRRTTHDKRQRERSKQEKAAAKRERRLDKSPDGEDDVESDGLPTDDSTTEQLLKRIEDLHADYDAGRIPFEDFDEQRATLMDRIAIRLAE